MDKNFVTDVKFVDSFFKLIGVLLLMLKLFDNQQVKKDDKYLHINVILWIKSLLRCDKN